jgi:biotin synthase-like enzyme
MKHLTVEKKESLLQKFLDYINNETPSLKNEIVEDAIDPAEIGSKYLYDLTPREKMKNVYSSIEGLKKEVSAKIKVQAGRLTREQTYRLCMYRRELNYLQSGEVF